MTYLPSGLDYIRSLETATVHPALDTATVRQCLGDTETAILLHFYRAVLAMGLRLCLSVTSRSSTKTEKRRITQTTPYDRDSSFLMPKISAKFNRGHPLRGHQMQVGWVTIGDFRQISGYISKTVKDRHIVSIKVE